MMGAVLLVLFMPPPPSSGQVKFEGSVQLPSPGRPSGSVQLPLGVEELLMVSFSQGQVMLGNEGRYSRGRSGMGTRGGAEQLQGGSGQLQLPTESVSLTGRGTVQL
jgi:hypothetical protein